MASNESVRSDFEGRFTFTNVPPGRYRLLLTATAGGTQPSTRLRAATDITVADDDLDNLVCRAKLATLTGRVVFLGTPPSAGSGSVQIHLSPAVPGPLSTGARPATPDESGRFEFADIAPGEYRFGTSSVDWFVEAATIASQDVLDQPLTITPSEHVTGVLVTLTNRRAQLAGIVVDNQGEPVPALVVVYPTDERLLDGTVETDVCGASTAGRKVHGHRPDRRHLSRGQHARLRPRQLGRPGIPPAPGTRINPTHHRRCRKENAKPAPAEVRTDERATGKEGDRAGTRGPTFRVACQPKLTLCWQA